MLLHDHVSRALHQELPVWTPIEAAHCLVLQSAQVLANLGEDTPETVECQFDRVLQRMEQEASRDGSLSAPLLHFLKVSASYRPNLFATYRVPGLPRTNNDLEQFFGSARYHERRISGRKVASPSMVIRGQVRLIAAFGTRLQAPKPAELRPTCVSAWRSLRKELDVRHEARRQQLRFRRDPTAFLQRLEDQLLNPDLPS
ncbi:hypothetical protein Q0M94_26855 (plasmid) [Deinococcus radiomollis]